MENYLMSRKIFGLAAAFSMVVAGAANAGVLVQATAMPGVPPFQAPDAALTGFTAYQVNVITDDSSVISAVDATFLGPMHQRWSDTNFDGVPDPTPQGVASNGRGDSSLTPIAGALIGSAPTEDNNVSDSPLADGAFDYGVGSTLSGAWGIPGASQTSSASVAYLVIPDGQTVEFRYAIATANGTFESTALIGVPEPATFVLAGISMLGLAAIRRRMA
ncbi:MAG: PEP-CTERM sorting domain-containing protein [Planctomycetales bacterium]|nr:PEP-CTERM sorting domain-containing protein [Planctomycetales bacterium]